MAIDGHRSGFPGTLDNFGSEWADDVGQKWTAAAWNLIQDALYNVERHCLGVMQTGKAGVLTPTASGSGRPATLLKALAVTYSGSASGVAAFAMPAFTTAEKALFGGTPLASGNNVHVQLRKAGGDAYPQRAYHAALQTPVSDLSGDSGWTVIGANVRHGNGQTTLDPGLYVVSLLITS